MSEEIKRIKSKSFISTVSLLGQSGYSAVLGFVAFFILTLKSGIHLLGIYSTVLAMLAFFNYFTDLGLAAAILQKKEVEDIDLSSAFFIQLTLVTIAVVVGYFLSPHLFSLYKDLPQNAIYLYWAILVSFFLLSLKSIPSVLLEKRIEIYKVVFVQALENTVFYLTVIVMVFMGYEIYSLVVAVLARAVVGVVSIYIMNPFRPKLQFSVVSAKRLLRYGIPFQSNSLLALVKDDLLVIYLGSRIGLTNLGYVMFGKKYAEFSIRLVMDNINRVAFPLFARFQKEEELLKKSLHKVLFYETVLIFPFIVGAMFVFNGVLRIIPGYYDKWHISLFSFYFFSASAFFVSLSTPFINLFNAIGKVKLSVYFMVLWAATLWILVPLFINAFGFNGISIAFFIMSLTFVLVYMQARKLVAFSYLEFVKENVIATIAMALYLTIIKIFFAKFSVYLEVGLSVVGGAGIYIFVLHRLKGKGLYSELFELLKVRR